MIEKLQINIRNMKSTALIGSTLESTTLESSNFGIDTLGSTPWNRQQWN